MTYHKADPKIYTDGEITDAIADLEILLEMANTDNLNQHYSTCLLIAMDVLHEDMDRRRHLCFETPENQNDEHVATY